MASATASGSEPADRGPSIGRLFGVVHLGLLFVPLVALLGLRFVDRRLVESTESRLIAEAVVVAEAYRAELARAEGRPPPEPAPPPWAEDDRYWPVDPQVDPARLAPPEGPPTRSVAEEHRAGPPWAAGAALGPVLRRAQRFNLAGLRVLGADGCVVGSSGDDVGACLDHLPEVRGALDGGYTAVGRERISDEPTPALSSIRRRGDVRLFVALPVFERGRVVAVVRASRTALDPLEAAWRHRGLLLVALLLVGTGTWAVSTFLSRRIAGPLRALTGRARRVADGEATSLEPPAGRLPIELADLSAALATMTARLAGHAAETAESAATLSHELKTPIAAIRGATELLADSWDTMTPEQRARFLTNIDADAERMQRLVSRLLALARLRAPTAPVEAVPVRGLLEAIAERHGVAADVEGAPAGCAVVPHHLEMAVGNLVDNAIVHGGPPVTLTADTLDGRLRVRVSDGGGGIDPAVRPRIFDRFFTTRRDAGGTGLGLAIVREIATARGGSVEVESDDRGTSVTLIL